MPDLKDLLRPLDDEPMPDRWDRIRRRPIEPIEDPRRSRRIVPLATATAVSLLVVAVIAALGPLRGSGHQTVGGTGTDQPPSWLVDAAYREAYGMGDMIPDSARWTLLPRSAIPTPVGPDGAGDPTENYVVVLHGNFVGYTLSAPSGASLPKGSVLSIAYEPNTHDVTDLGLGDQDVDLAGLQPLTLPGPEDTYTSPQGWSIAVPPGWKTMPLTDGWSQAAGPGAVISNHNPELPLAQGGSFPQASPDGFPTNGLTLVIAKLNGIIPGTFNPKAPPLSYDDFAKGSAPGGRSTLDTMVFSGPDGEYTATVRTGRDASPIDIAAIHDVVASLTITTGTPSIHQSRIWIDSRNGVFFDPPPGDAHPLLTADQALARFKEIDRAFSIKVRDGQLGLYTDLPQFSERLAYGYAFPVCLPSQNPHASSAEPAGGCTSWLFLDANTGRMLEALQQQG